MQGAVLGLSLMAALFEGFVRNFYKRVLLYPQTTRDFRPEFETHGHRIRALTLDLSAPWQAIHTALLGAILSPLMKD